MTEKLGMEEEIEKQSQRINLNYILEIQSQERMDFRNTHVNFKIDTKNILVVNCLKSETTPCFYNKKEFY